MCLVSGPEGVVGCMLGQSLQLPIPSRSHVLQDLLAAMVYNTVHIMQSTAVDFEAS